MSSEPRWLDSEEAAAWLPFVVTTMRLFAALEHELRDEFDISHLDYGVLSQLSFDGERPRRMSELARRFGVGPSVMTYRVDRLEGQGFVERVPVGDDGRGVAIELTPAGSELLERAAPAHVTTVRELFVDRLEPHHLSALAEVFGMLDEPVDGDVEATAPDMAERSAD